MSPVAHDGHSAHEESVYVKRFCGPVYVLVDLSYISQQTGRSAIMLSVSYEGNVPFSSLGVKTPPELPAVGESGGKTDRLGRVRRGGVTSNAISQQIVPAHLLRVLQRGLQDANQHLWGRQLAAPVLCAASCHPPDPVIETAESVRETRVKLAD